MGLLTLLYLLIGFHLLLQFLLQHLRTHVIEGRNTLGLGYSNEGNESQCQLLDLLFRFMKYKLNYRVDIE